MADVLLLAVAVRLALDGGQRRLSFHLMIASIVCLLATDFLYGLMLMQGTYDHQVWLDPGLDRVLPAVGGVCAASVDGEDRPAGGAVRGRAHAVPALAARRRISDRADRLVDDLSNGDYDFAVVRASIAPVRARGHADGGPDPPAGALARARAHAERRGRGPRGRDRAATRSTTSRSTAAARAAGGIRARQPCCTRPRARRRDGAPWQPVCSTPPRLRRDRAAASRSSLAAGLRSSRRLRPRARCSTCRCAGERSACCWSSARATPRGRAQRSLGRSPRRSRSRSSARRSPRRCTGAAARRASARWSATPAT